MSRPGDVAGLLDRLQEEPDRLLVADVGGEPALVAQPGGETPLGEHALEHVVALGAPSQGLGERGRPHRDQHELLDVEGVVGVGPAVEHVEHRHREGAAVGATQVPVQRQAQFVGGRPGRRQRGAEDGVGAQPGLVVGGVEGHQPEVEAPLVERLPTEQVVADLEVDAGDGAEHPLAHVPAAAVPALDGLVGAGGRSRRDDGAAASTRLEQDLDLHGRIAPRVEYLPAHQLFDRAQCPLSSLAHRSRRPRWQTVLLLVLLLWAKLADRRQWMRARPSGGSP